MQTLNSERAEVLRLSAALQDLAGKALQEGLTLGELIVRLEGRVYTLLLILLSVPFCQPLALPGLSTPFGLVIALLGMRFAFRQKPWLPKRVLMIPLSSKYLPKILTACARLLSWIEKFLHPRMTWMFQFRITQFLAGSTIFACGVLLLLPLPVPFSNLLPAMTVVAMAASMAERDGAVMLAGWGIFALTLGFFAAIFLGGAELVLWLKDSFTGLFDPADEAPGILPLERSH
ncbi:MAG: exopolysaccharide biosynthesis protein [Verrucomicrobiales bacterium]